MGTEFIIISIVLVVLFGLQRVFPREKFSANTRDIKQDFIWFVLNEVIMTYAIAKAGVFLSTHTSSFLSPINWTFNFTRLNSTVQLILFILILDFVSYWTHRVQHMTRIWEIHKLHHSIETLSPLSSYRHSFLETIYNSVIFIIVTSFLSVNPQVRNIGFLAFTYVCVLQHTNIRIPFTKSLSFIFITPDCHVTHHSYTNFKNHGQNFGFIFSVWDRLFKTYVGKDYKEIQMGIENNPFQENMAKNYLYPLIKSKS